ncbi:acetylornithine deacetylase [Aureimonas sp. SA4125]|uniref:acetylornithine deacetylase n=1 Tax=Aureimonas sp. SA4125 TaxID=2826993 RepID=UPI001CC7DC51|nr:acetylornithine deacetylase [Aureimonas sp. SA4125]BDA84898.1 acetylornithine deacetylase [Aureimonas sp. SA4125]
MVIAISSIDILDRLIAFPTVSRQPNMPLLDYVAELLAPTGARVEILSHPDGKRANLFASLGPEGMPGVMLSGHTDVVPVEGQDWTVDPFRLTRRDGRLYGRGAADMKGFVACAVSAALKASRLDLATPLHLALSYDEEIGCIGVADLVEMLAQAPVRPLMCIVGEPTAMAVATGHKGKGFYRACCHGREGHSALAPNALNALHLATDLVGAVRRLQAEVVATGIHDLDYDIPYTTLHVARVSGGTSANIVPNYAEVDFEIRHLAGDDPKALMARLQEDAAHIVRETGDRDARIEVLTTGGYPGLDTAPNSDVVAFVKSLTGGNATIKVAFGTEGGLFSAAAGIPTVVCGPGSMAQGHRPDEFVSEEQLARCDSMMDALVGRLAAGL